MHRIVSSALLTEKMCSTMLMKLILKLKVMKRNGAQALETISRRLPGDAASQSRFVEATSINISPERIPATPP
jgi:hypothetical protein